MISTRPEILVFADPDAGRDVIDSLANANFSCRVWPDFEQSEGQCGAPDAVLVLGEQTQALSAVLEKAPARYGLLPIIAIKHSGSPPLDVVSPSICHSVTTLDWPVSTNTLVSVMRTAILASASCRALRRSEQRFSQFMEHIPGLAWIKDSGGRYIYANLAAARVFKTSLTELYGKTDDEVFAPETAQAFKLNDQMARVASEGLRAEEVLEHDDGLHYSIVSKFRLEDEHESEKALGGVAIDITPWKHAENAEALLAAIVKSSEDAIISMTLDGRITSWNAAAVRLYGYSTSEILGSTIAKIIPPTHRNEEQRILEKIRRGEPVERYETVRLSKSGRLLDVSLTVSPVRDKAGHVIGASKVARDVSVKRQAEGALRRSEQRFRLLAESVPSIIWGAAPDGTIEYVNPQWTEYTGLPTPATLEEWAAALHPDDRTRCMTTWRESSSAATEFEAEMRCRRWDGIYRWFVSRAVPSRDSDGRVNFWCAVSTDVDDQRQMAESLREANRRKDEFLATLAHELRNPLAPIRNSVELLKIGNGAEQIRSQALAIIERQTTHLVRLVDDLLQVSRMSRGKIELYSERVSLASIVDAALEEKKAFIDQAGHTLRVRLPVETVIVQGDPVRLTQMLSNLLDNAAKFTGSGGTIDLAARRDGEALTIAIRDDGIGLDADALPGLFDMFTQADPPPGRARGGLGVGLALVRMLAQLHGGTIKATSSGRGKGSEFTLRLPIVVEA